MVAYFYHASYTASKYDTCASLLHAQVAILADKYACASLYKLASTLFAESVQAVNSDDWSAIAEFVYNHTTTDVHEHVKLRGYVVAALADRHSVAKATMAMESVEGLLRSSADLAIDLLLGGVQGPKAGDGSQYIFVCTHCQYMHAGSRGCEQLGAFAQTSKCCPQCSAETGRMSKRFQHRVKSVSASPCPSCNGVHTMKTVEDGPACQFQGLTWA